jgi:miniconductance mechanosensitive channel
MEIYVFTKDTNWAVHESVQADIFDHILAVVDEFDLRVAQDPTGYDLRQVTALAEKSEGADLGFAR